MHNEYDENLLEPLKYYNNYLKGHFRKVTEDYFQELVDEAGIDIDKNTELMKEYEEASRNFSGLKSKLNRYLFTKKVIFIIGGGSLLWGGVNFFSANGDADSIFICGILFTLSVGLYFGKVKSKIEDLGTILENLDSMLSNMRQEGYQMMKALNNLFHSEMTAELIKKAIPFIHLDLNFNIRRYEQLVKNYNFKEKDDLDHSTLDVASGDILGNPFVFMKRMVHKIGEYTYKGSLNISYLKYYRDSNGKLCSSRVNETLHAEVKKPGPYYSTMVSLVYGNDAAPELIFHRKPAEKGIFSAFFKKAKLAKKISTIRSQTNKAIKEGGTFQGLSNEEFDALFNALDRNNEIEFRLLFTPLAQQNYQDIFKNSPYGDDFVFCKENKINKIESKNSQNWDFDTTPSNYWGFSFQQIKDRFINFNCNYFDCMYFSFLPLLAIPLYQQMMSNDYVYKDSYNYNYNDYITEMIASRMGITLFRPQNADIRDNVKTMIKTSHYSTEKDSEIVQVDAYSYRTVRRIDYVPVLAGNGKTYNVPVEWEEYVPVKKREYIEVTEIESVGEGFQKIKELDYYQWSDENENKAFAYGNYIAGKLYRKNEPLSDLLKVICKKYVGGQNGEST